MATSRVKKFEAPVIEETQTPQEVLRLQTLLEDNGWKMLMDRIDNTIDESIQTIAKPRPLWMTQEETNIYYEDLEKVKMKIECYRELKVLPYQIMREYGETEFTVDNSSQV